MWVIIIIGSLFVFLWIFCNRRSSIITRIKQSRVFNVFIGFIMTHFIQSFLGSHIHKIAVRGYKREVGHLISVYSKLDKEELADYLVMSVWTRAMGQIEGYFKLPDGQKNIFPSLDFYMLSDFERIIKELRKRRLNTEAIAMSIWVHTLRGLLYELEMGEEFNRLWQMLMTTKSLWDKYLTKFYNEDKDRLNPKKLSDTMALAKEILSNLPPKR